MRINGLSVNALYFNVFSLRSSLNGHRYIFFVIKRELNFNEVLKTRTKTFNATRI